MNLKDAIKECEKKELLRSTVELISVYNKNLSETLSTTTIIDGSTLMISQFILLDPSFVLGEKFKLVFKQDGFGPHSMLEYKNYEKLTDKLNVFEQKYLLGKGEARKYCDILCVPWEELAGLECEFSEEVNGWYLEHLLAYLFLDLSYFGFLQPTGDIVDTKIKNLLDLP